MGLLTKFVSLFKRKSFDEFKYLSVAQTVFDRANSDFIKAYELGRSFHKNKNINPADAIYYFFSAVNQISMNKELVFPIINRFVKDELVAKDDALLFMDLIEKSGLKTKYNTYSGQSMFKKSNILLPYDSTMKFSDLDELEREGVVCSLNRMVEVIQSEGYNITSASPQLFKAVVQADRYALFDSKLSVKTRSGEILEFNSSFAIRELIRIMFGNLLVGVSTEKVFSPLIDTSSFNKIRVLLLSFKDEKEYKFILSKKQNQ
jgi:hypothetical protein